MPSLLSSLGRWRSTSSVEAPLSILHLSVSFLLWLVSPCILHCFSQILIRQLSVSFTQSVLGLVHWLNEFEGKLALKVLGLYAHFTITVNANRSVSILMSTLCNAKQHNRRS